MSGILDNLLDTRVDALKPHVARAGDVAVRYADRIVARLDAIHDAMTYERFLEQRRVFHVNVGAGQTVDLAQVPTDSEWLLEAVACDGAATVALTDSGAFRWISAYAGADTKVGAGVIFQGANALQVVNVAGVTVNVDIQVRVKSPRPVKRATTAGDRDPIPDSLNSEDTTSRHGQHVPGVHVARHRPI